MNTDSWFENPLHVWSAIGSMTHSQTVLVLLAFAIAVFGGNLPFYLCLKRLGMPYKLRGNPFPIMIKMNATEWSITTIVFVLTLTLFGIAAS